MSPIDYVNNLTTRRSATYFYSGSTGVGVWRYNNEYFSDAEFDEKFPIETPFTLTPKTKKPDSQNNIIGSAAWMK